MFVYSGRPDSHRVETLEWLRDVAEAPELAEHATLLMRVTGDHRPDVTIKKEMLDATHLRRKYRLAAAALAPTNTRVRYVVLDRPLKDKLRDARTPEAVVRKHDHVFRSQVKDILAGDGLPNVDVVDL